MNELPLIILLVWAKDAIFGASEHFTIILYRGDPKIFTSLQTLIWGAGAFQKEIVVYDKNL